jgi:1-acyl-sn-glycerol-3-phosphate acyltransferase
MNSTESFTTAARAGPHPLAALLARLARGISGVRVRWVDSAPPAGQCIYFANHTSHLDAVVLWAALPAEARSRARPVAASDYWERNSVRRYLASRVFHAVLIERRMPGSHPSRADAGAVIQKMVDAMGENHSLIVFPEGTRGTGEEVAPFKSGLYHLASRMTGVELVPSYLENLNRILPKGEVLPVPLLSSLTFGPPIRVEPWENKKIFLERAREAVRRLKPS